ncbi:MAG: GIY-YIG nuclease family protein [Candidatus Yonathbacteria bacterium]|nr:GIY-YIG nuclease family protein [Candidatus Yonathbacteria bacterium]
MQRLTTKLPNRPGVYIFRGLRREIFYIGKATFLRTRVASYFRRDLIATRGPIIEGMVEAAKSVDYIETDSVLEALILEAHLIKRHQPPYNTKEKDNKSFNYVVITNEDFPRVMTMRGREMETRADEVKYSFGPFPQGSVLREALSIMRKIFPFRDKCLPATAYRSKEAVGRWQAGKPNSGRPCFNVQIGLCPGVCAGTISKTEYGKTIRRIKLFFKGKKKTLVSGLEREMKTAAKNLKFEEAGCLKRMIFALNHIQDVAIIKQDYSQAPYSAKSRTWGELSPGLSGGNFRIEAYDVAHISGTNVVGVMVVLEDSEPKKSDYRKFKIRTSTNDDNASLREMLERRFNHSEWPMPKLIVVDGGKAQVNTAEKVLKEWGINIPVVGVVKDEHHKPKDILHGKNLPSPALGKALPRAGLGGPLDRAILLADSEAHRFAIGFHRQLRGKIR